jgi:hypothetical protein
MKNYYYLLFIIVFLNSCNKEEDYIKENISTSENQDLSQEAKLLVNPYEISNMRSAYERVVGKMNDSSITITKKSSFNLSGKSEENIVPNYIYVRFNPENEKEESLLKDKRNFLVIDYPFEYENSQDYQKTISLN